MKKQSAIQWILLLSVCAMCMWPAVLALAEQRAEAEVQLQKAEGMVEVTDPAGRVQQRFANMKLDQGNRICTEEDGTAWIGAESGEQLRLDAGSRMELRTAGGTPEYLLDAGNLYFYMEGQEEDGVRIRTAAAAMHAQGAVGWVKVTDRYHTVICLLEGTLQCAVTDPVTGQMKQAAVTGGSLAECVIDPNASRDSRCDILLRDLTAEDLDGFVLAELTEDTALAERLSELSGLTLPEAAGKRLTASREKLAAHMEKMLQESRGYAALRDPVWTGDRDYASVAGEADESAQGKDAGQGTSASSGTDNPSSGSSGRQPDAQTVPVVTVPVSPASSAPEAPSPKKKKGSGSSAPAEPEKPAAPSTPATPSTPAGPTENQGLVIEGIAHNGPQGVIEVQEGGRIHVEGSDVFRNEGKLTSSGVIDSKVSNEGGEFLLSGGSVVGVEQKGGTASITGGTVTGSSSLTGGTLQITGGQLAGLTQSEGSLAVSGGTITDVCSIGGGEFHLSGGTVASVRQSQGDAEISGGNVTGDCVVEGGSLQITDGRLARVTQNEGTIAVSGGMVVGECSVTGGDFRLTGGTVASVHQSQGAAEISGGNITGDCVMEGGSLQITDGQLARVTQKEGTFAVSGGAVAGECSVAGGDFRLSGGTLASVRQSQGNAEISGGNITGDCVMEGGSLQITDGQLARVTQNEGTLTVSGGTIAGECSVAGGDFRLSGGTVASVRQSQGDAEISGGTITGSCSVEGGTFQLADGQLPGLSQSAGTVRISGGFVTGSCALEGGNFYLSEGTVDKIAQKAGTASLSGGSITNGCALEGGRLELSGGIVQAGSAEAALAVQSGFAARSKDTAVTAENANAYITGGSLIGNGQGKSAIYAEAGTIMVADAAKTWIKATEAFRTITGSKGSGWAVRYVEAGGGDYVMGADSFDNPDGSSVIYVTKKESDGLMRLRRLSDDFLDVSRAGAGDVLTLCGDVTYQTAPSVLAVTGGTAEEPVTLDLNGRTLNMMDQDMQGGTSVEIREDAVWEISGGQICAKSICGKESGTAVLSGTEIRTSAPLLAEGSSILTIRDCTIPAGVGAGGSGTLQVSASELGGMVQGAQNGTITISGTKADLQQIQNTGSAAITLSDASKLTISQGVYNAGTIQVDGAELLSGGGEIANEGTMNLTGGTIAHILQKDGIFHMDSGTVFSIQQSQGKAEIHGGAVTGDCTIKGGSLLLADGRLASVAQSGGTFHVTGGEVTGACYIVGGELHMDGGAVMTGYQVEGGTVFASAGTIAGILQINGTINLTDNTVVKNCEVENGTLTMTGGTVDSMLQKGGTVRMSGGELTGGCSVQEDGSFVMSGGTLKAGNAEAALKVAGTPKDIGNIQAEHANAYLIGGTVIGAGKKGIWMDTGTVLVDGAVIKAADALDTITGVKDSDEWAVRYRSDDGIDYVLNASSMNDSNETSVMYVTKKDTNEMMILHCLSEDFSYVAKAEDGDVITLSGDVKYDDAVEATGGTEGNPVILNLNDKTLNVYNPNFCKEEVLCFSSAVWKIGGGNADKKGKLSLRFYGDTTNYPGSGSMSIYNSCVSVYNAAISNIMNESGVLTLSNSEVGIIQNQNYSTADITCSKMKRITNTEHSKMAVSANSVIETIGLSAYKGTQFIDNSYSSQLTISDSMVKIDGDIRNDFDCTLHIINTDVETASRQYHQECVINNSGVFTLSKSKIGGIDATDFYNVGTMTLSNSEIKAGIYNGGINGGGNLNKGCSLDNCQVTVSGKGIRTSGSEFRINGGEYKLAPSASELERMILFDASRSGSVAEHSIEIGGKAILDTQNTDVIPLEINMERYEYADTDNFEILINESVITGGEKPAIRGGINMETVRNPEQIHTQRISINDGASISSGSSEGTVILESRGNCPKLYLNLQGGEIINEGKGPALCMTDFENIHNMTTTKIKSKSENPLAAWTGKEPDFTKPLPSMYDVVEDGEYYILLRYDPQAEESAVQVIQEDKMDEEDAKTNELEGQTDEEPVISKDQEQPAEGERKPDDPSQAAEGNSESESSSQPDSDEGTEDGTEQPTGTKDGKDDTEQSAGTKDGEKDTEQSAGTEDGSASQDPSTNKEDGSKDTTSPSDQTEEPGDDIPSSGQTEDSLLPDLSGRPDPASQSSDEDEEPDGGSSSGKSGRAAHPEDAALPSDSSGRSRAGDGSEEADTGE